MSKAPPTLLAHPATINAPPCTAFASAMIAASANAASATGQNDAQLTLRGAPAVVAEINPWLWLGQWLHVGNNSSMGLGGYTLATV